MILRSLGVSARTRPACRNFCAHCGLPAPAACFRDGSEGRLVFCCRACRQVYDLVRELPAAELITQERPLACAD